MSEEDLFMVTKGLTVEDLIWAYSEGAFPWPQSDLSDVVPWFKPLERGVLFFNQMHYSQSFKKFLKKHSLQVTFNKDFFQVISQCAKAPRKGQCGTWIGDELIKAYVKLFNLKRAYSVEVWEKKNLVGGLYGVLTEQYVSGESMFFKKTGASKLALYVLVKRLEAMGLSYIDTQMITPVVQAFGGVKVSKEDFDKLRLSARVKKCSAFFEELGNG